MFESLPEPEFADLAFLFSVRRTVETVEMFRVGVVMPLLEIAEKRLSFKTKNQQRNLKQGLFDKTIMFTSNVCRERCNTICLHK